MKFWERSDSEQSSSLPVEESPHLIESSRCSKQELTSCRGELIVHRVVMSSRSWIVPALDPVQNRYQFGGFFNNKLIQVIYEKYDI
jgi:hypothetical protein